MLDSFGIAATALCIHLTGMVVLVFLFFLVVLSMTLAEGDNA